jgi:hypothetical protein
MILDSLWGCRVGQFDPQRDEIIEFRLTVLQILALKF